MLTSPIVLREYNRAVDAAKEAAVNAKKDGKYPGPAGGKYVGPTLTAMTFQRISLTPALLAGISEFIRLVKLGLTFVGTSVENERVFSSKKFLDDDLRPLKDQHLNVCLRAFKSKGHYSLESFPYNRAFEIWKAEKDRRLAHWTSLSRIFLCDFIYLFLGGELHMGNEYN